MTILIAKANKKMISKILPQVKFNSLTANTCTFKCTERTFESLYSELKLNGYNPFAIMSW